MRRSQRRKEQPLQDHDKSQLTRHSSRHTLKNAAAHRTSYPTFSTVSVCDSAGSGMAVRAPSLTIATLNTTLPTLVGVYVTRHGDDGSGTTAWLLNHTATCSPGSSLSLWYVTSNTTSGTRSGLSVTQGTMQRDTRKQRGLMLTQSGELRRLLRMDWFSMTAYRLVHCPY